MTLDEAIAEVTQYPNLALRPETIQRVLTAVASGDLIPADDLAEVAALRADRDGLAEQYAKVLGRANTQGDRAEAAEVEVVRLRALVEIAGNARLLIDTGFSEMGETVNYRPSLIAKVCDMLNPHAALQPTTPEGGKG